MFFHNFHPYHFFHSYGKALQHLFSLFGFKPKETVAATPNINYETLEVLKILQLFHRSPEQWYTLFDIAKRVQLSTADVYPILEYLIREKLLRWWVLGFGWIVYALEEDVGNKVADILRQQKQKEET